jgi:hypothetical protein
VLLDPLDPLRIEVQMGTADTGRLLRFRCPLCGREETSDREMGPMCTGPSWTDDHPYEIMELVRN